MNKLLVRQIKKHLGSFDKKIESIEIKHGPIRKGDIPHSLASIKKAEEILNYQPSHNLERGLKEAVEWYWNNLK